MNYLIMPTGNTEKYAWTFNEFVQMVCKRYGIKDVQWYHNDGVKACVLSTPDGDEHSSLCPLLLNVDMFDWVSVGTHATTESLEAVLRDYGLTASPQEQPEVDDCKLLGVVNNKVVSVSAWYNDRTADAMLTEGFNEMLRYAKSAKHLVISTVAPTEADKYACVVLKNSTTGEVNTHEWRIVGRDFVDWLAKRPADILSDATPEELYTVALPLYAMSHRAVEL